MNTSRTRTGLVIGSTTLAVLLATTIWYGLSDGATARTASDSSGGDVRGGEAVRDIHWLTDYQNALSQAEKAGKFVVVDFFATWCVPCQMMEQNTFADANVKQRMADFVALKIDVDQQREIAAKYGITGLPTTAIIDSKGVPVAGQVGYLDAAKFIELLDHTKDSPKDKESEQGIVGHRAPDLGVETWYNLPEVQKTVDLADYKGKVVYLYGFQSWCPGCHRHGFPTLTELIKHYKGNDKVAFIAVQTTFEGFGTNTPEKAKETADRYKLSIPVGHSGTARQPSLLMQRYRTGGTPWTVIIGPDRVVQFNDFHIQSAAAIAKIDKLLAADR